MFEEWNSVIVALSKCDGLRLNRPRLVKPNLFVHMPGCQTRTARKSTIDRYGWLRSIACMLSNAFSNQVANTCSSGDPQKYNIVPSANLIYEYSWVSGFVLDWIRRNRLHLPSLFHRNRWKILESFSKTFIGCSVLVAVAFIFEVSGTLMIAFKL